MKLGQSTINIHKTKCSLQTCTIIERHRLIHHNHQSTKFWHTQVTLTFGAYLFCLPAKPGTAAQNQTSSCSKQAWPQQLGREDSFERSWVCILVLLLGTLKTESSTGQALRAMPSWLYCPISGINCALGRSAWAGRVSQLILPSDDFYICLS